MDEEHRRYREIAAQRKRDGLLRAALRREESEREAMIRAERRAYREEARREQERLKDN